MKLCSEEELSSFSLAQLKPSLEEERSEATDRTEGKKSLSLFSFYLPTTRILAMKNDRPKSSNFTFFPRESHFERQEEEESPGLWLLWEKRRNGMKEVG